LETHGYLEGVLTGRDVTDGQKPDHERVRDGELSRLDVREDAEDGVLAGAGVDVDAVAGEPSKELRFGLHGPKRAVRTARGKSFSVCAGASGGFFLECWGGGRLVVRVLSALLMAAPAPTMVDSLADYPRWFVALCVTIVLAVAIWIVMKLLKWTLWLLLIGVLIVGFAAAVWLFFR
jgi:hypothetical protein